MTLDRLAAKISPVSDCLKRCLLAGEKKRSHYTIYVARFAPAIQYTSSIYAGIPLSGESKSQKGKQRRRGREIKTRAKESHSPNRNENKNTPHLKRCRANLRMLVVTIGF